MIAKDVGTDISTLYYHWGEKQDLYEAVIADIGDEIKAKLNAIETRVSGSSIATRMEVAIEMMCDALFSHPEIANLILFGYFGHAPQGVALDLKMSEHIAGIAVAMGLAASRKAVSVQAKARILAVWNTVLNRQALANPAACGGVSERIKKDLIPCGGDSLQLAAESFNFISGESFFRPLLGVGREEYIAVVKETLTFILVPAFTHGKAR
jgi:AcrR family transcriptional regulator